MDKSLKDAIKAALLAERKRGMDLAVEALERAYDDATARDELADAATWEIKDTLKEGIIAARNKLK